MEGDTLAEEEGQSVAVMSVDPEARLSQLSPCLTWENFLASLISNCSYLYCGSNTTYQVCSIMKNK